MKCQEKSTKDRILEEALVLFAKKGYLGTSMNDIAARLGVTKAALYKHYAGKQEILDCIVKKMNQMDQQRVKQYAMPEGSMTDVVKGYQTAELSKIAAFTKAQFRHWTEEVFPSRFRKMLTLEQYRDPKMAKLYQYYLASEPVAYMAEIFKGFTNDAAEAEQLALEFYGPIFLMYSLYDGAADKDDIVMRVERHVEHFSETLQAKLKEKACDTR